MDNPYIIQYPAIREEKITEALTMLRTPSAQNKFIALCEENPEWVITSHVGLWRKPHAGLINWKTGMMYLVEDGE